MSMTHVPVVPAETNIGLVLLSLAFGRKFLASPEAKSLAPDKRSIQIIIFLIFP